MEDIATADDIKDDIEDDSESHQSWRSKIKERHQKSNELKGINEK